jgi:hypothetical protein
VPLNEVYFHLFPNIWDGGMTVLDVQVAGQPVDAVLNERRSVARRCASRLTGAIGGYRMIFVQQPTNTDVGNYGDFAMWTMS